MQRTNILFAISLFGLLAGCAMEFAEEELFPTTARQGLLVEVSIDHQTEQECESRLMFKDAETDELFEMSFFGEAPLLRAGLMITLEGTVSDQDEDVLNVLSDSIHVTGRHGLVSGTSEQVIDERLLVMVAQSNSQSLDLPAGCNLASIRDSFFGSRDSVATVYEELSNGQTLVSGEVVGPYNVGALNGKCRRNAWIKKALRAYPGDASQFNRRVVVIPSSAACGSAGMGEIKGPGETSNVWISARWACDAGVIRHELGHGFGMHHASSRFGEYGDFSDFMGAAGAGSLNAPHRVQMNWVQTEQLLVTQNGSHLLDSLDKPWPDPTDKPRVLKIDSEGRDPLLVSYRTADGLGGNLIERYRQKVNIHRHQGKQQTIFLAGLSPGESYSESGPNGLSVRFTRRINGAADVELSTSNQSSSHGLVSHPLTITNRRINAWVYDEDAPSRAVEVEIWLDDLMYTRIPANLPFVGWKKAFPEGTGRYHRVNARLSTRFSPAKLVSVWALDIDANGNHTGAKVLIGEHVFNER